MNAKLFQKWLIKNEACADGLKFAEGKSMKETWATLDRPDWMMWLYGRRKPEKKKCVKVAIFCAELCIDNFEKAHPDDKRPRLAIEAAKAVIAHDTAETRSAARSAAGSAGSAAWSAWSAARSAAGSAWSAAESAAWSVAESAAGSARSAAESAVWSARKKICAYIRKLIPEVK